LLSVGPANAARRDAKNYGFCLVPRCIPGNISLMNWERGTPRPLCCLRSRRAFSLVELLVVIGIIGVLIGILLPALSKARKQSQEVQCASILRTWGQAFQIYAGMYAGFIPHSQDETENPFPYGYMSDPACPQNDACYTYLLPPLIGRQSWLSYPYYQKPTDDIWQCPLAQVLADSAYDYSASEYGYHSYAMNEYLDAAPYYPIGAFYPFLNLAKARWPSVTLLMIETTLNPAKAYGGNSISLDCNCGLYPDNSPADLGDRHPHQPGKLGGNLLMLDGHVEWTNQLWDPTLPNPQKPPRSNQTWWPY